VNPDVVRETFSCHPKIKIVFSLGNLLVQIGTINDKKNIKNLQILGPRKTHLKLTIEYTFFYCDKREIRERPSTLLPTYELKR